MPVESASGGDGLTAALEKGELSLEGQFLLGSNYTFLVNVVYKGHIFPAVYKPMRGEQPLWDFPPASLAGREVAACQVSTLLGLHLVPATVLRDGPYGPGSLQQYVEYDPGYHYFNFKPADRSRLQPVALFDLLINNADRKGSHVIIEKETGRLFAIDHGLCFHSRNKLRTVIWDFAGEPVPPNLVEKLHEFGERRGSWRPLLQEYLLPGELSALEARLDALLANPVYPRMPEDRRAFPYPPV